ncbi:DUF5703 domain-containing protein [Pedobacter sp. MW01-1-1]|uniref:DUF5703 domain-containing protein n=1 Tax=Pedobacter sp. MW01-1-1 TaxID=3383027 RepID=UPI003FEDF7E2
MANAQDFVWTSQSKNSAESMPLGGGDIGTNVWVEKDAIYVYLARSGTFDENNSLLKLGRLKIKLFPNPLSANFTQRLVVKDGYIQISGKTKEVAASIKLWVDVFKPVLTLEINADKKIQADVEYQSWRTEDRVTKGSENNQNSYKWAPQGQIKTFKDSIAVHESALVFYHQNKAQTVFDVTTKQQGLADVKQQLYNPLNHLIFGGLLQGDNLVFTGVSSGKYLSTPYQAWKFKTVKPTQRQKVVLTFLTQQNPSAAQWKSDLIQQAKRTAKESAKAFERTVNWWHSYWNRSFIAIQSPDTLAQQVARNYQLFRYMLGCNAYGAWPTKFNGALFTFDPELTNSTLAYTPDFRNWGGGTHTAQNQRLVYWPMLKSGDFDAMKPQFDFYLRLLKNAEIRTQQAWGHSGASFTEQIENFGLPNPAEYGWKRPQGYNIGLEYNAWLEYEWDTVLEFCMMILERERYTGTSAKEYLPLIESCLTFFKEHYTYLAKQRGSKGLDMNGHLVLYPGSAAETYKMAYNASSTIAGLKTVLGALLASPSLQDSSKTKWEKLLASIPPINFRTFENRVTISPAKSWERINNTESPQLYPVFPWGMYGVGKAGLDTAINTFKYDADVLKFRSHVGWKQDNIFAARLGLTAEAKQLTELKLKNSGRRFSAFWGPGFDWTPDFNWGGSGMIGLQEMLIQCDGKKIFLFPSWPKEWNIHFKLHAPFKTTVEVTLKDGKIENLTVLPQSRAADIVNMLKK